MRAALDNFAVIDHQNFIGIAHGAEAVGDDKRGAAFHQPLERLLDELLGGGVHAGGGLIENEDRRIRQQRARHADALLLAHAQLHAALAHARTVALGHLRDEIMAVGGLGGGGDFVFRGTQFAVLDILADGAVEEKCFLTDHRDMTAQRFECDGRSVLPVDGDAAPVEFIKRRQQVHQRGFARASGADQRNHLARLGPQADFPQHRPVVFVFKADLIKNHLAAHGPGQRAGA